MNSSEKLTGCDDIIKRLREATDGMYYAESKAELDGHRSNIIKALGLDHDSAGMTALLDRLDAAERENERLKIERATQINGDR